VDVAFLADKGGVGKSTLAFHTATRLRQLGQEVALFDLDRQGTAARWDEREQPYFPAYQLNSLAKVPSFPYAVWDTPAHPSQAMRDALVELVDLCVVVATTDPTSQRLAAELARALERRGGVVRLVFNDIPPTSREGRESVEWARGAGLPVLETVVRSYRCYTHAHWDGRAVCDGAYGSADNAWGDICALTSEILAVGPHGD